MAEAKEWLKVQHSPSGTTAKATLCEGNLTVAWTVKTYTNTIKKGLREARAGAEKAMTELKEVAGDD